MPSIQKLLHKIHILIGLLKWGAVFIIYMQFIYSLETIFVIS